MQNTPMIHNQGWRLSRFLFWTDRNNWCVLSDYVRLSVFTHCSSRWSGVMENNCCWLIFAFNKTRHHFRTSWWRPRLSRTRSTRWRPRWWTWGTRWAPTSSRWRATWWGQPASGGSTARTGTRSRPCPRPPSRWAESGGDHIAHWCPGHAPRGGEEQLVHPAERQDDRQLLQEDLPHCLHPLRPLLLHQVLT